MFVHQVITSYIVLAKDRLLQLQSVMKWSKLFSAIVLGLAIDALRCNPTSAGHERNSSESRDEEDVFTVKPLIITWIEKPPYISLSADSFLLNQLQGMIPDAIMEYIMIDCGTDLKIGFQPEILRISSEFEMVELLRQNKVHIAAPIFENVDHRKYSEFPFFKLDDYPGTDYITTEDETHGLSVVLEAVEKSWPLFAVNLVLAANAGIIMWALVGTCFVTLR